MAISVTNIGGATSSSGATVAVAIPAGGVPQGALIVVGTCDSSTATGGSCADTINSYSSIVSVGNNNNASAYGFGQLFYSANVGALTSTKSITYTKQTTGKSADITAFYATGIAATLPLDTAVTKTTYSTSVATDTLASGTPAVAGELFVGFTSMYNGGNAATLNSISGGFSSPPFTTEKVGDFVAGGGYLVNAGTGTETFGVTFGNNGAFAVFVVGFKPAPVHGFFLVFPGAIGIM